MLPKVSKYIIFQTVSFVANAIPINQPYFNYVCANDWILNRDFWSDGDDTAADDDVVDNDNNKNHGKDTQNEDNHNKENHKSDNKDNHDQDNHNKDKIFCIGVIIHTLLAVKWSSLCRMVLLASFGYEEKQFVHLS